MSSRCRSAFCVLRSAPRARRTTLNARRTAVLLVALWAAGCATAPLPALDAEPRISALRAAPLPVRLAVAAPTLDLRPAAEHAGPSDWPAAAAQRAAVDALRAAGVAGAVRALPAAADTPAARLDAAWAQGDDLLCEVTLRERRVGYVATNGWYLPNLALWALWVWPAWFVPDEEYDGALAADVSVRAVSTGREVWRGEVAARVQRSFDDFDRGIVLFGALRVPGALDESNWRAVDGVLRPLAEREWQLTLAEQVAGGLRAVHGTAGWRAATRQTLAVVVGCGKYASYALHNLRHAAADTEAVADWLRRSGVPDRNCRVLVDDEATAAHVEAALTGFVAPRARPGDRVVVYWAGYAGPDGAGGVALLPYDTDPSGAGALSLTRLAELLRAIPDAEVLCVVDAGLGGAPHERWAALGRAAPEAAAVRRALAALAERPATTVVWACGPGEGAAEADDRGHGLLTANWLDAVATAADADGDGAISVAEAFRVLAEGVQTHALLGGRTQSPASFGAEAAGRMALPRVTGDNGRRGGGAG